MPVQIVLRRIPGARTTTAGSPPVGCLGACPIAAAFLARELGQRRSADGLTAVFTSDRRRAVQTAEVRSPTLPAHEPHTDTLSRSP